MKVATAWINKWLSRTMSDDQIVSALERAGLEIEQHIASKPIDKNIVIGLTTNVIQHPSADRLKLVQVSDGRESWSVVCGAPNVVLGMKVAFAPVGAVLPDGTTLAAAKIRGEISQGMLCSERELGLGEGHSGILEVAGEVALGTSLCDLYKTEAIVDLKTPANRFDVLSVVGLAREVAAMTNTTVKPLPEPLMSGPDGGLELVDGMAAARFMLVQLEVDPAATSPDWLMQHLAAAGVRPISLVVDITNYVNLEIGQPLHAYDAGKVRQPMSVRPAKPGEQLLTLDGVVRKLTPDDLVVADTTGPVALAGVMGGKATEVDAATTTILLEAATFDAVKTRKMAQRHGLRTEASARFERGLPVQLAPVALARATQLLLELAGAEITGYADQLNVWPWVQRIGLRQSRLDTLLGIEVSADEAAAALKRLSIEAHAFDIAAEARQHLGKPYVWGASFKKNGIEAFDCSYFTDYLYSLIGRRIGYTSLAQYELGQPVADNELKPGDILFYEGHNAHDDTDYDLKDVARGSQKHSIKGHYYLWDDASSKYIRHESQTTRLVGHNGLYVGDGRVIHASKYEWTGRAWREREQPGVMESEVAEFTSNPGYLGARRFAPELDDYITVPAVPWWRPDLKEGSDLVEEIVRVLGYDRIPSTLPAWRPASAEFDRSRRIRAALQQTLQSAGLFEVMTYSFVSENQLKSVGEDPAAHLKLKNPLSTEQAYLRSTLLASHLSVLARNRKYADKVAYYELSKVFERQAAGEAPHEPLHLAVTLRRPSQAYAHLKGLLDALAAALNVALTVVPAVTPGYAPGRVASVSLGSQLLGYIGLLDAALLRPAKIVGEVAYMELAAEPLLAAATPRQFTGLRRFPATRRDVAVVLSAEVTWLEVAAVLGRLEGATAEFVSDYYGAELPPGHKSLAFRLTVSHPDRTPTEGEAAAAEAAALKILARKYQAVAR